MVILLFYYFASGLPLTPTGYMYHCLVHSLTDTSKQQTQYKRKVIQEGSKHAQSNFFNLISSLVIHGRKYVLPLRFLDNVRALLTY